MCPTFEVLARTHSRNRRSCTPAIVDGETSCAAITRCRVGNNPNCAARASHLSCDSANQWPTFAFRSRVVRAVVPEEIRLASTRRDRGGWNGRASPGSSPDVQILQVLGELRAEVSALRSEVLGQNQQMLSRIQFLHEGLIGRIKQMREQPTLTRRRGR